MCLFGNSEPPDEMMCVTSEQSSGNDNEKVNFCIIKGKRYESFNNHTFFGDTGTSHVMDTDTDGLYDAVPIRERIGGYGGEPRLATWKGKKDYRVPLSDGTSTILKGVTVKVSEEASQKLFPLQLEKDARNGNLSTNREGNLQVTYPDGSRIVCDRRLKTKDGWVSGFKMVPIVEQSNIALLAINTTVDINEYHKQLGHPNIAVTRSTAKARNVQLTGTPKTCVICLKAKAKKKSVPKSKVNRAKTPGERLFIDISSPTQPSIGGNKHWLLVLDDFSDCPISFFLSHKDMLKVKMIALIKQLRNEGIDVKIIRCDNAGENVSFQKEAEELNLGLVFEYTAPDTPQQNGRVERKFQTLYGCVRAVLFGFGLDLLEIKKLCAEAASTATTLDATLV